MNPILKFFILIPILFPATSNAVSITYTPQVINYSVADYKAGNQNWSVSQSTNGRMYFGNNRGLLEYDGVRWKLFILPNNAAVRSLYITKDNRIYVGSFEEFGYFEADTSNRLIYYSLKEKVEDYAFFNDEIWTINEYGGKVYFQSFSSFFIYDGENVWRENSDFPPFFFYSLNNKLYAHFINEGFYQREKDSFVKLVSTTELANDDVVGVLPFRGHLLLVTVHNGLYVFDGDKVTPWNIPCTDILKTSLANRVAMTRDSTYIIGTISNGIVAINTDGKMVWHLNRKNHLANNTILGLHVDLQNNLWAALDNGIARIQSNSPIYIYEPKDAQIGMVYDMVTKDDRMYLATNQGIYTYSDGDPYPLPLPKINEQTWFIDYFDNQLIAGYNRGTLSVSSQTTRQITGPNGGGTAMNRCIIHGQEILLQASYTSLSVFKKGEKGEWLFSHNIDGFSHPVRSFEVDPAGNIWIGHMYKGVYRITLDETLQTVKTSDYIGMIDKENPNVSVKVMKLRGRIVLTDGHSFYTYEDLSHQIVPYAILNESLREMGDTYHIISLNNDRFWFIRNSEYVLVNYNEGRFYPTIRIPFSLFKNPIIEDKANIYVDKNGISYFCLNGGIARFDPKQLNQEKYLFDFAGIKAYNRNNEYRYLPCTGKISNPVMVDYRHNHITFELSLPEYSRQPVSVYYRLNGYDSDWMPAPPDYVINYSNIPYGSYTFEALLRNIKDEPAVSLTYPFRVKPPFYLSFPAFILYILLFAVLFSVGIKAYTTSVVRKKNRQIEEQKKKQEQQLKEQERLIIKLQNEKLEDELSYKSKELASTTLSLIAMNDFLTALKKDIQAQVVNGNYSKKYYDKLLRWIEENLTKEDEWDIYQNNFDRVHEHFFRKLKARYPDLTPGDLRMCALLRLNMPTKDMAKMLNLSVRGVEGARYRLRRKLTLPEGENLIDFMITFK
ncbi:MAG: hypothetical protein LBL58_19355 [Tannerellaceae bacterium]|jgi:hypothetical protein|nr:hypothetical protein [Tannerellaceae bacterium]